MTTQILIRNIARGDRASFETLYRNLQRPMLGYAMGILAGDREAAEDAVDEAFVDIWRSAASYSGAGNAEGWVRRIVRNKSIDWLRRQKGDKAIEWFDGVEQQPEIAPNPEEMAIASGDLDWLRQGLSRLNVKQREALILCYFEERPLAEIAAIMECPENTVKTRLFHARMSLRQYSEKMTADAPN